MKCDFDNTLTNSLCKDMNSSKILNHWLYFYSLYIKRLVGREGGGSSSYIFIEKRMLFPIAWVWFSMNTYLRMYIMFVT